MKLFSNKQDMEYLDITNPDDPKIKLFYKVEDLVYSDCSIHVNSTETY